ncbi:MAG: glycosyltransferase family 61 protein [Cyclobacteriaceae bacterium]
MKKILFPPEHIQRPLPMNFHGDDASLFQTKASVSWEMYYQQLNQVTVNTELFVKQRIKILPISFGHPWQGKRYNGLPYLVKTTIKDLIRKKKPVDEAIWVLDQFSTGGYYHWLTEILPRIWSSQSLGLPSDLPFYFPEFFFTKWNFGRELLAPFNINSIPYEKNQLLKIRKMHFVSQAGGPLSFQSVPLKGAIKVLKDYYYDEDYQPVSTKIYISRNRGSKRCLLNEDDLLPVIEKGGFQVVYTEELSIKEQINIFSRAEVLMSIHGAGLTNMVFMEEGRAVVEIRNKSTDHMVNCFLALADTVGLEYNYLLGDMIPQLGEHREIDYSMELELEKLRIFLKELSGIR